MSFGLKVTGNLAKQLEQYKDAVRDDVETAVKSTAIEVVADSVKSIQRGSKSGRIYKRGDGYHQASAPGEAPASDSGRLAGDVSMSIKGLVARVGTNVEYGRYLEFGTMNILERPWLRPALDLNEQFFYQRLKIAIREAK